MLQKGPTKVMIGQNKKPRIMQIPKDQVQVMKKKIQQNSKNLVHLNFHMKILILNLA